MDTEEVTAIDLRIGDVIVVEDEDVTLRVDGIHSTGRMMSGKHLMVVHNGEPDWSIIEETEAVTVAVPRAEAIRHAPEEEFVRGKLAWRVFEPKLTLEEARSRAAKLSQGRQ